MTVALGTVARSAPVAATPFGAEFRSHQYNLCEVACTKPNDPEDMVVWMMSGSGPHTTSLNEVCIATARRIANQTTGGGFTWYGARRHPGCPNVSGPNSAWFGNATLVAGINVDWDAGSYFEQADDATEIRGWVCRRTNTYVGYVVGCSTHLHYVESTALTQANEYAFWVANSSAVNYPMRVLSGDLNIFPPGDRPPIYQGPNRAYDWVATGDTVDGGEVIDYVHVAEPQFSSGFGQRVVDFSYSDHVYVYTKYH